MAQPDSAKIIFDDGQEAVVSFVAGYTAHHPDYVLSAINLKLDGRTVNFQNPLFPDKKARAGTDTKLQAGDIERAVSVLKSDTVADLPMPAAPGKTREEIIANAKLFAARIEQDVPHERGSVPVQVISYKVVAL